MKKFIVISHTHWDREWYAPFSNFRLRLIDLMKRLFDIFENEPDYIFHLDAQTVVLEDYLEIHAEDEARIKRYISEGRLVVGPWYLQNDFYLTGGESTIRNLQVGTSIAEKFGACSRVGYAPDQFGNISQLPQILAGFGIDTFLFGRGHNEYDKPNGRLVPKKLPAEFCWVGPDGSKCVAVFMACWYNNAQHISSDIDRAKYMLKVNEEAFEGRNVSPFILLMNGVDHLEAQGDIPEIVGRLRKEGIEIEQTSLDSYFGMLKDYLQNSGKTLPVVAGALNRGYEYEMLRGCWSSRSYLKQANVRAESLLTGLLEPLYALLEQSGMKDVCPKEEFSYLWKSLMKNHPHDNICGCSRDEVHEHMEDRFAQITEMGEELLRRGMEIAANHTEHPLRLPENGLIAVFNPSSRVQKAVIRQDVDLLPEESGMFAIADESGKEIPYAVIGERKARRDVFSPVNLPGVLDVVRRTVEFSAELKPLSVSAFAVVPGKKALKADGGITYGNEFYSFEWKNGHLSICIGGRKIRDPFFFEEAGDRGHSYVYEPVKEPSKVFYPTSCEISESTPFVGKIRLGGKMVVPARYDFDKPSRSEEQTEIAFSFELTVKKNSPVLEAAYYFENTACDHRVRFGVKSDFTADAVITDSPFDCAEHMRGEQPNAFRSETVHNSSFVRICKGDKSVSLLTEGQHEAEHDGDKLYLTLVRSTGVICRYDGTFEQTGGEQWVAPGNQCLRKISGRFGICFSARDNAECFNLAREFRAGTPSVYVSCDTKKFSGGRFAVQDAKLCDLYYLPDPYDGVVVRNDNVRWDDRRIVLSAYKTDAHGDTVVRLFNASKERFDVWFYGTGNIYKISLDEKRSVPLGNGKAKLNFGPSEIITVKAEGKR